MDAKWAGLVTLKSENRLLRGEATQGEPLGRVTHSHGRLCTHLGLVAFSKGLQHHNDQWGGNKKAKYTSVNIQGFFIVCFSRNTVETR